MNGVKKVGKMDEGNTIDYAVGTSLIKTGET
ncbi:hypothetical protein C8N36_107114 [Pelagimonas varians]|uniref:Uncharacterized protein n=1 Tax=Pelagimonas varians TaxID=696760 RepID=A0A238KDL6_9RHOB|nr:hypothetical protein C8N36_107114 [Pelagimonas varians]SMX40677.1 hypothetical protein PEV8663_02081 [Pelagimonas varians]